MAKYRKKPVVIDAVQFTREMAEGSEPLPDGVQFRRRGLNSKGRFHDFQAETNFRFCHRHMIDTLEGEMDVQVGDYVIRGVAGEFYLCNLDIFEATYEAVEDPTREPLAAASEPVAWAVIGSAEPNRPLLTLDRKADAESSAYGGGVIGYSVRPLVFGDVTHPSAAAVTVTEAMAMAALRSWAHHINANNSTGIEAMTHAITAALTAAPAVPVVELDEWRVVDKDNRTYLSPFSSSDTAEQWRRNANVLHHEAAPHRVMRLCLPEVDRG